MIARSMAVQAAIRWEHNRHLIAIGWVILAARRAPDHRPRDPPPGPHGSVDADRTHLTSDIR
jgi:hypothetical protein